jgi:hypothetical protein
MVFQLKHFAMDLESIDDWVKNIFQGLIEGYDPNGIYHMPMKQEFSSSET